MSPGASDLQAGTGRVNPIVFIGLVQKPKHRYFSGKCHHSLQVLSSCLTSPVFINLSPTQQRTSCLSAKLSRMSIVQCVPLPPHPGGGRLLLTSPWLDLWREQFGLLLRRVFERCPPPTGSIGAQGLAKATPSQPSGLPIVQEKARSLLMPSMSSQVMNLRGPGHSLRIPVPESLVLDSLW